MTAESMKNRFWFYLLVLAASIVGCSDKSPDSGNPAETPAPISQASEFAPSLLKTPLPGGFDFPLRYHVRDDRIFELNGGAVERRIVIDALDGNVTVVRKAVDRMFQEQGFKGSTPTDYKNGQRVSYRHRDGRRVNVTSWSKAERKPQAPGAQAVVYFGWPVAGSEGR